jgi:hypothetical protein
MEHPVKIALIWQVTGLPEILALEWLSIGTFFRSECLKPRATETVQSPLLLTVWFLIAGEQITQAKNHVNQSMSMEQLQPVIWY